ncbi:MAG: hypothetical protein MUF04_08095, partial [Akkermansiaceae bacterium]|nr:hypothetical protein [Akkermansiaceae bacterium]
MESAPHQFSTTAPSPAAAGYISSLRSVLAHALLAAAGASLALADPPPDRTSGFAADAELWIASPAGVTLTHHASGGADGGYLAGKGPGGVWHFVSPPAWAGNWTGYRALAFDLAITSKHYADSDAAGMVTITNGDGQSMTWNGPTPLWTWTHYEVSIDPASFGVDQATFDAILADVAEVRILAEFTTASETVGLDEVRLTASPPSSFTEDLVERFGGATKTGVNLNGWSPVDDCTLTAVADGQPLHSLKATDWRDGRYFKVASPTTWAGDWSRFEELRFDVKWNSSVASAAGTDLIRIIGANGTVLSWGTSLTRNAWQKIVVPLTPEAFGVTKEVFDGVFSFVNQIWILGEYNSGLDELWLDNVVLATGPETPKVFASGFLSRFGAGTEGWFGFDGATLTWSANGGFSGGALSMYDTGTGTMRFCSPDAWAGDWRTCSTLRFMIRPAAGTALANFQPAIAIYGFNGTVLNASAPQPYPSWTPYTYDLTPQIFGVDAATFEGVMANVAHLTIVGDLVNTNDTTLLDDVGLYTAGALGGLPPERFSGFDADNEGWRKGGRNEAATTWGFLTGSVAHDPAAGNPGGCVTINDEYEIAYWFSPERWAGDWRGYQTVSFDLKIIDGTQLLAAGDMLRIFSPHGILTQSIPQPLQLGVWNRYEFALTPEAFGVTREFFDKVMRDVFMLGIRAEWISGNEREALDNVRLSKGSAAYWEWLAQYLTPEQ